VIYKGYLIKPDKAFPSSLVVATEGQGGKIPTVLEGLFTSYSVAKTSIDTYLETKVRKNEASVKS
jgi:hypothetical protein